jgi:NAD+ kinase
VKIGVFVKPDDAVRRKAAELEAWLKSRGIEVVLQTTPWPGRRSPAGAGGSAPADLFCVFVLGGDGTFLSASRWIGNQAIPVLGIKFGEVGFLAATAGANLIAAAERVLNHPIVTESRMRMTVRVFRDGSPLLDGTVLNDVVINKGALARLARIRTSIDNHYLTTYSADGLIIATPTGSTAYSLAAGGPVIHPAVPGMILTPICPFTLTNRPLIVPDTSVIEATIGEQASDIMLTLDGQAGFEITRNDVIQVQKGVFPLQMIVLPDQQYYDVLKSKLRWSGGRI